MVQRPVSRRYGPTTRSSTNACFLSAKRRRNTACSLFRRLDAPKNRADRRKKTNRYYFRLTDDQAKKLDRLLKKLGYSTVQSFCEALIRQEVSRNGV